MLLVGSAQDISQLTSYIGWAASPLFAAFEKLTIPTGVTYNRITPDFITFRRYTYVVGQYSPGLVVDPFFFKVYQNGIAPPGIAPVIAVGTGSPGITETDVIGYVTFGIKLPDGSILMESNPSPESNTITLTADSIDWTSLPTSCSNPAVNIIRLWRSVAGEVPRVAAERSLGVTTANEEVPTLELGAELPNTEGTLNNANGVPPHCRFIESWHDRAWYGGDTVHPTRLWFSEVLKPWAVSPTSYFETRDGEPITGVKKIRDKLVVFTKRCTYTIVGWQVDDFVQAKESSHIGCISHHSIVEIDNRLWFAAEDGVYTYDGGSFFYQMDDLRDYWKTEYLDTTYDYKTAYENSVGSDDRFWKTYKLLIPRPITLPDSLGFYYVGHYGFGAQAQWVFDLRTRRDGAQLGHSIKYNLTGSTDGRVRLENYAANHNDDNDTSVTDVIIRSPVLLFDQPGGDQEEGGKTFVKITSYVESELNDWTFRAVAGDEDCWRQLTPDNTQYFWKDDVSASFRQDVNVNNRDITYCAKSVHTHYPEKVTGRGLVIEIHLTSPNGFKFRGFGGWFGPGPASRKPCINVAHDPG